MAPICVCNHLCLVYDGYVVLLVKVCHFYGGGCDPAVFLLNALLAGEHGTGDTAGIELLVDLQGKEA